MASDRNTTRTLRELALTGGAVLGVVCLLAALLGATLHVRPLIFRSGSMSPGIPTGSLGLARTVPASDLRRGQVVSVFDADGTRITHRVVALTPVGDAASLTLQGDANRVPDADPYVVRSADRLFWSAPRLGYAVSSLSGRTAAFAGGLLVGILAMITTGRRRRPAEKPIMATALPDPPDPRPSEPVRVPQHVGRIAGVVVLVVLLSTAQPPGRAYAAWNDSAIAKGGSVTTVTVPTTVLTCSATITTITFRWTAVSGATKYVLTTGNGTTVDIAAPATSYQSTTLFGSGTASIQAVRYTGAWRSVASNTVRYVFGLSCN